VAVRYPRGAGGAAIDPALTEWPWGKGVVRRESTLRADGRQRIAMLAFGTLLHPALAAAQALDMPRWPTCASPSRWTTDLVLELARSHDALVTVEEGCIAGGAGSAVAECLAAARPGRCRC
jgi:1-deoxy-D-xylulose-5-phosphate synthase